MQNILQGKFPFLACYRLYDNERVITQCLLYSWGNLTIATTVSVLLIACEGCESASPHVIKSEHLSAWLQMSHAVLPQLKSTTNSEACDPALHTALYNCLFLWAKSGRVNSLGRICCGTSPAVSSRADFQNPEPTSGCRSGNPFTKQKYLTAMSFSHQIKALSYPMSIHMEYKYILSPVKKRTEMGGLSRAASLWTLIFIPLSKLHLLIDCITQTISLFVWSNLTVDEYGTIGVLIPWMLVRRLLVKWKPNKHMVIN